MSELLNKLYNLDYFGYYLLIAIVLLLVLFVVILFFGKKDQHKREVEATKKLQQINSESNAFKEENNVTPLEVTPSKTLENSMVAPKVEEVPSMNTDESLNLNTLDEIPEPVLPVAEPVAPEVKPVTLTEQTDNVVANDAIEFPMPKFDELVLNNEKADEPLFSKTEEIPFSFSSVIEDTPTINPIVNEEPVVNKEIPVFSEIEVPEFNFDEIVQSVEETKKDVEPVSFSEEKVEPLSKPLEKENNTQVNRGPQIFSSVYVPETKVEKVTANPGDDEIDFELPVLKKKEEKIEKPVLNDYNLDDLAGEEYNLKR